MQQFLNEHIVGWAPDPVLVAAIGAQNAVTSGYDQATIDEMDARGLNVAASDVTSDYWQGDEAKFTQTYPMGGNAVHFGDVELDESTKEVQGQVSMSIVDQETGEVVGALTVGINLTALM